MTTEAQSESAELCGIPGEDGETITKEEFNRFVRVINYYHGRPLKHDVRRLKELVEQTNTMMQTHIESDHIFFAKLMGAKWALWVIAGALAFIVPFIWQALVALRTVGIL